MLMYPGRPSAARPRPSRLTRRPDRPRTTSLNSAERNRSPPALLQLEAVSELVLDPVAVVACHEPRVVDEEAEARWPRTHLRAIEEVEAAAVARRRLPGLPQARKEAVQFRRGDPARVLVELLLDPVEQAGDPTPRLRGDGQDRRPLPQPLAEPRSHVLDFDLGNVPLRQDGNRRALRLAGDIGNRQ